MQEQDELAAAPRMYARTVRRTRVGAVGHFVGRVALWLLGWRAVGRCPDAPKVVAIAAPHTTNWDLFFSLLTSLALRIPMVFMMKDSVFWWPMGTLWRWLGGIPVNRRARTSAVEQMAAAFAENARLTLVVAPEGTRKHAEHWKLGFYWIALKAEVPVMMCYIDYARKEVGVSAPYELTGDLETDFAVFRAFYEEKVGVRPSYAPERKGRDAA